MRFLTYLFLNLLLAGFTEDRKPYRSNFGFQTDQPSYITFKKEINFIREMSFGETKNVLIGKIGAVAVDNDNRVFIADGEQSKIHVYRSDGSYLQSLGRSGRGPGEFNGIHSIKIHAAKLFAADREGSPFPLRINIYSLKSLSHLKTINLLAKNRHQFEELNGYYLYEFYARDDGNFLVSYAKPSTDYLRNNKQSFIRYFIQNRDGEIISDEIFKQPNAKYLSYTYPSGGTVGYSFPFFRKSLITISTEGEIYTANTGKFVIKRHSPSGNYLSKTQYPFETMQFKRNDFLETIGSDIKTIDENVVKKMIDGVDLPNTWPALQSMFFDDQDRLWISTIVENAAIYQWWLLEKNGDIITKFNWPRDKPIKEVKNGYMYTLETEEATGLQEIVRYRIEKDKK